MSMGRIHRISTYTCKQAHVVGILHELGNAPTDVSAPGDVDDAL